MTVLKFTLTAMAVAICCAGMATQACAAKAPSKALDEAVWTGDMATVQRELKKRPNLDPRCGPNQNCKPLARAAMKGHFEIIRALIEAGADPNGVNAYQDTAYVKATYWLPAKPSQADRDKVKAIRLYLLDHGLDPNQSNSFGVSHFAEAAARGDLAMMEVMLNHKAKINHQSRETGTTALMMASAYGKTEAVQWLLDHGADASLRGKWGTALDSARSKNHADVVALLTAKP